MGGLFQFTCVNCGYKAQVSGRPDRGFFVFTDTMACARCQEIFDVVVGVDRDAPPAMQRPRPETPRCPMCHSTEITPWADAHPCPKCGAKMDSGDLVLLWD